MLCYFNRMFYLRISIYFNVFVMISSYSVFNSWVKIEQLRSTWEWEEDTQGYTRTGRVFQIRLQCRSRYQMNQKKHKIGLLNSIDSLYIFLFCFLFFVYLFIVKSFIEHKIQMNRWHHISMMYMQKKTWARA